jgi:hypothetical protein
MRCLKSRDYFLGTLYHLALTTNLLITRGRLATIPDDGPTIRTPLLKVNGIIQNCLRPNDDEDAQAGFAG